MPVSQINKKLSRKTVYPLSLYMHDWTMKEYESYANNDCENKQTFLIL